MDTTRDLPHQLNQEWADAFNAGDLPRLMTMYEPDAVLVPGPGAAPVHGLPAIESAMRWFLALGGRLQYTPRHWLVQGDLVLSSVAFEMDGGRDEAGNPVELRGVTDEVARRQADGSWKYVIDHPFGGAA
ncbi:YybH family protein [Nakamurella endophytica]|uniref:SnoaL-like domain-containing protein n=1 Tax=Nakamurella endophytica TaxID=1748367 RepID=A0A917WMX6_9ACTN|nr:nuclear transport factor 2 family protein [Nakamurella endophytica]GGM17420.1 hypothetical protein GCM10011594_41880 [Nakamurella endophytica]